MMVPLDTQSDERFIKYYEQESLSPGTVDRFKIVRDKVLKLRGGGASTASLRVIDIGCGAGTQCVIWAKGGHSVYGVDVNESLIEIARKRAVQADLPVTFEVASATALPFPDASFDVSLIPELLEHVQDWEACLNEAMRVLRPGGILYLSTTNRLCPRQQEFRLPAL